MNAFAAQIAQELTDAGRARRRATWWNSRYERTLNIIAARRCVERAREMRMLAASFCEQAKRDMLRQAA